MPNGVKNESYANNTSDPWRRACGLYRCSGFEQDEVDLHLLAQNKYTSDRVLRLYAEMCLAAKG